MTTHDDFRSKKVMDTDRDFAIRPVDAGNILRQAVVPEHSVPFMRAMSGGEPFTSGDYLFFAEDDWLMAIGYPLSKSYDQKEFRQAVNKAVKITGANQCWAVSPRMPEPFVGNLLEKDVFFILDVRSRPASRLLRLAEKAERSLRVEMNQSFTKAHRKLWEQFLNTRDLPPRVLNLYLSTERVIKHTSNLILLNAWDRQGNLAACLMLDSAPHKFLSYIIGAHSREHYTPYSTDLLFREMLFLAEKLKKEHIHLGIGVNPGIRRFKVKWGGKPFLSYELADWRVRNSTGLEMLNTATQNKSHYFMSLPEQRKFKMLWEVEKNGKLSWIGGSAHFFRYSFRHHFKKIFERVETVIFEGPLDKASLAVVAHVGKNPGLDSQALISCMNEEEIRLLENVVQGPRGFWAKLMGMTWADAPDVRYFLGKTRPWMAFFSLWSGFLRRMDWKQSVDREAWELAKYMDKNVLTMERIEDQIQTLESIPVERIINFFRACGQWRKLARQNEKAYLKGDLEKMFGTSTEFPSRTELVIHHRDRIFLERMTPHLRQGNCLVFVGTAHMFNLRRMLAQVGFRVRKTNMP